MYYAKPEIFIWDFLPKLPLPEGSCLPTAELVVSFCFHHQQIWLLMALSNLKADLFAVTYFIQIHFKTSKTTKFPWKHSSDNMWDSSTCLLFSQQIA